MTYAELRKIAKTGDALFVGGNLFVRVATAESYSHVACLVWMPDGGLWVFEFTEDHGYRSVPASQWFEERENEDVWLGIAPVPVHFNPEQVKKAVTAYRNPGARRNYGWLSLIVVWFSQVIRRRLPVLYRVCSTFVQEVWETAGFKGFARTADPGDVARVCQAMYLVSHV